MYTDAWLEELREIARSQLDVVHILQVMIERHEEFTSYPMRVATAFRRVFDLSVIQISSIVGWLEGNLTDDDIRQIVPSDSLRLE
ncbi:hypothetical protein [Nocardia lijiangensis]|uniref:hypothetical protein n=1 Tax=Nocardia lijiangensis TaxID=299618 RepID=UPI003D7501B4